MQKPANNKEASTDAPPVIRVKQEFNEVDENSRQSSDTNLSESRDPRQRSRRESPPDRRISRERQNRASSRDRRDRERLARERSRDRIRNNREKSRERPPYRPRFDPRERRNDLPWRRVSRSPSPDRNRNRNFHQKNQGPKKSFLEEMHEKFPDMNLDMSDGPPGVPGMGPGGPEMQGMPPMMNQMMFDTNGMPMMNPMMNGFAPGPVPPPGFGPRPNMPVFPPNMPNMSNMNMSMFPFGPGAMNGPPGMNPVNPGPMIPPIMPQGPQGVGPPMPMQIPNIPVQRQPVPQNTSDPRLRQDPRPSGSGGPSAVNFDYEEAKKKVRDL